MPMLFFQLWTAKRQGNNYRGVNFVSMKQQQNLFSHFVLGRSIIGKSVTLLKINYLQLQVVHILRRYTTIQLKGGHHDKLTSTNLLLSAFLSF